MNRFSQRIAVFFVIVCTIVAVQLDQSAAESTNIPRVATPTGGPSVFGLERAVRTSRWVSARVNRTSLAVNDVLIITFTVKNYQTEAIKSWPYRPTDANITFDQDECWAVRKTGSISQLYPKHFDNYRVMAGYTGWDAAHATPNADCATSTSGPNVTIDHPWRWGIGESTLLAGATRTVTGRVRFTRAGTYTVYFGLIRDYAGYPNFSVCTPTSTPLNNACYLNHVTIVVGGSGAVATKTKTQTLTPTESHTPTPTGPTNTAGPATDTPTPSETYTASRTKTHTKTRTRTATRGAVTTTASRTATRPARTSTRPARTNTRVATAVPTDSGGGYPIPTFYATKTRTPTAKTLTSGAKTITIYTDVPAPVTAHQAP